VTDIAVQLRDALRDRYTIERELGIGGMATVYLAQDLKHHRKVAAKVLRPELAATLGPDRFLREIETAAQFQHPHILPLLDSGEAGGFLYYVMPYVAGESLRERLTRVGELPIHEAVKILVEITDALVYAHALGVVHRDIKPENVMLSGRHALVMDFGVAKAVSEATGRQKLTTAGVALGTPAYMAPEQAAGDPHLDHRVDVYALGVVGYELLAGVPPFRGHSAQEVLGAHVTQAPEPVSLRRPACPPQLAAVIMKCLEKRPADRWQSAEELLAQLEPLATPSGGITPTTTRPVEAVAGLPQSTPVWRWLVAGGGLLAVGLALTFALNRRPTEIRLGRRTQVTLMPGLEIDPALSPDGRLVAFAAGPLPNTGLYVRQVTGGAPVAITLPEVDWSARRPSWSPDGSRLTFKSNRGLEVIPALGGASRLLLPYEDYLDATWSPDGKWLALAMGDSVYRRSVDGNETTPLFRLAEVHSCAWASDGRWIACVSGNRVFRATSSQFGNIAPSAIWVAPVAGGPPVRVTDDQSLNVSPVWVPGRRALLFISNRDGGRDVYEVHLDRAGKPSEPAMRLTTGLNAALLAIAADGHRLAYAAFSETSNVWSLAIPASGAVSIAGAEPVTSGSQVVEGFDVSADGRWLVFDSDRTGEQQIYRVPLAGGEPEQLTSDSAPAFQPAISPDGRKVAYHSIRSGWRQLFVVPVEGGAPTQITTGEASHQNVSWSPDGTALGFGLVTVGRPESSGTAIVRREPNGRWSRPQILLKYSGHGVWSPDGRSVLADSAGSLAVVSADATERRTVLPVLDRTTDLLSLWYQWSPDGQRVLFIGMNGPDARSGVWSVPAGGGTPRLEVKFDDSTRPWHRYGFRVRGKRYYFTLGDLQSDIWTAEIATH
jgi:Tol biopolymer transport system component